MHAAPPQVGFEPLPEVLLPRNSQLQRSDHIISVASPQREKQPFMQNAAKLPTPRAGLRTNRPFAKRTLPSKSTQAYSACPENFTFLGCRSSVSGQFHHFLPVGYRTGGYIPKRVH